MTGCAELPPFRARAGLVLDGRGFVATPSQWDDQFPIHPQASELSLL